MNTYGWVDQQLRRRAHSRRPGHGSGSQERLAGALRRATAPAERDRPPPAGGCRRSRFARSVRLLTEPLVTKERPRKARRVNTHSKTRQRTRALGRNSK